MRLQTKLLALFLGTFAVASVISNPTERWPLYTTIGGYILVLGGLEALRRQRRHPWWVTHIAVLPWGVIVLAPWCYFAVKGSWFTAGRVIDTHLGETWVLHGLVLVGIAFGSALAVLSAKTALPDQRRGRVDWLKLDIVIGACVAVYFVSTIVAGRPIAAMWRLSGSVRYFDDPSAFTPLQILDYFPAVASFALLICTAVRRRGTSKPSGQELVCLVVLSTVSLGSGARSRLYVIVLGWLVIQFGPLLGRGARAATQGTSGVTRAAVALAVVGLGFGAVFSAQVISNLRSRGMGVPQGSLPERVMRDIDVVGTGELLFELGATEGMLKGQSYSELPLLVIPRKLAGADKPRAAAADGLVRSMIDPNAGYAAPLWLEAALNYGGAGALAFGFAYAFIAVRWIAKCGRAKLNFAASIRLLGPVWVLVSYLMLSRLTIYQMLLTLGTAAVGCFAGSRCIGLGADQPPIPSRRAAALIGAEGDTVRGAQAV